MLMVAVLIANRGEIAVRIIRSARDLGLRTIAVAPADDTASLHARLADELHVLPGSGPAAYLNTEAVLAAARDADATAVHPGYGFLAESAAFASACAEAGLVFVGPSPEALATAGDKEALKQLARKLDIPVAKASGQLTGEAGFREAEALLSTHPDGIAIKATAGGGGRGIAVVTDPAELPGAIERCRVEAEHGFGDNRVFAETWVPAARHIEIQCLGTAEGVVALGDRDCSLQRRRQKLIELAPAPGLSDELRTAMNTAATRLLGSLEYRSLATVEFLVSGEDWLLLEVNPRIQVEHTVTEATTGLDLVALQLSEALGAQLSEPENRAAQSPSPPIPAEGSAIEVRICAETLTPSGQPQPSVGTISSLNFPSGPGVRIDTWVQDGTPVGLHYDTLLAKIIVWGPNVATACRRLDTALQEFSCAGVKSNASVLRALLETANLGHVPTSWYDEHRAEVHARAIELEAESPGLIAAESVEASHEANAPANNDAGYKPDKDPELEPGEIFLRATISGTVVSLAATPGELGIIEAMKMHHPIPAPAHLRARPLVAVGEAVSAGQPVFAIRPAEENAQCATPAVREQHPLIDEVIERHVAVKNWPDDDGRNALKARGRRCARDNIEDLMEPGSFVEYGPLAIAAQRARRSRADLIATTSTDGIIGGIGRVMTGEGPIEAVVMSYDYLILAGTQGLRSHLKTDRLLELAASKNVPVVLFAEGGGGRPGDTDRGPGSGLSVGTFAALAGLKGRVPLISVVSGRCFAGNAALAGMCDIIIVTDDANLGMGGPAMVEGGGLGSYRPEDIGPVDIHETNGVLDVRVTDDAAAVVEVRRWLSMLCARTSTDEANATDLATMRERLRSVVPADRLRSYDMREAISAIVDAGSFAEVRSKYAPNAITAFARVDGHPVAVIANDNRHLGGAIDVNAARSFTELLTLADARAIPVVSFVDTPGFMVGPKAEHEPGVRVFGKLFIAGAHLRVPMGAVIVRKGYGLGAMAMTAGALSATHFTVAWPSGEIGPMGLEGAVRLGFAKELAAIKDTAQREERFQELLAGLYEEGSAMTAAEIFDIDDVIDPAATRAWITTLF